MFTEGTDVDTRADEGQVAVDGVNL